MNDTLFAPLTPEIRRLLDEIPALIDKTFPLPARFRSGLPANVAELSRLLTSGRGERGLSYLGRPPLLSAYLRFFLPWNLYRLCRLLPGLDIHLAARDRITDLGCGPLTLAAALWISRPDLRPLPLEFHCIDRSGPVLDAGKKFFAALAGADCPWNIHMVKGDLAAVKARPAVLVCAVNVFNEMYGDISRNSTDTLRRNAEKSAHLLKHYAAESSAMLVVEPGFPRCGEFISLLRSAFMEQGGKPLTPCPHDAMCPFPGGISKTGKNRWCHFSFETDNVSAGNAAPGALQRLSAAARLPKERAVLSFLFMGNEVAAKNNSGVVRKLQFPNNSSEEILRVISDAFPLPRNQWGRYGCSLRGLVLLAGDKNTIEQTASGALVNVIIKNNERDAKSGALLAEIGTGVSPNTSRKGAKTLKR